MTIVPLSSHIGHALSTELERIRGGPEDVSTGHFQEAAAPGLAPTVPTCISSLLHNKNATWHRRLDVTARRVNCC